MRHESSRSPRRTKGLRQAFDEVRFGARARSTCARRCRRRMRPPTRTEAWLRQQQVERADEVLIITGRGNNSDGGVSVVREAVIRLFTSLQATRRRQRARGAHAGSFVVTLAPVSALWESPKRNRGRGVAPPPPTPPSLDDLDDETRDTAARSRRARARRTRREGHRDVSPGRNAQAVRRDRGDASAMRPAAKRDSARRSAPRSTSTSKSVTLHFSNLGSSLLPDSIVHHASRLLCSSVSAPSAPSQQSMTGYSPASAARERDVEAERDQATVADDRRPRTRRELSQETHVAGTPAQARTRDYVIAQMKKWGIETEVRAYDVWMPHPDVGARVARVAAAEGVRARRAAGRRRSDVDARRSIRR